MKAMICNGLLWRLRPGKDRMTQDWADPEALGFLPSFLDAADPRSAREQFDAHYQYGGDWRSEPHGLLPDDSMTYPGDPPLPCVAETKLRDERILFYPAAFVAIVQPDGSFVVQRMD